MCMDFVQRAHNCHSQKQLLTLQKTNILVYLILNFHFFFPSMPKLYFSTLFFFQKEVVKLNFHEIRLLVKKLRLPLVWKTFLIFILDLFFWRCVFLKKKTII